MTNIYVAWYICKELHGIGIPGYNNVVLGLSGNNEGSDLIIKGTCSRFEKGKDYLITVATVVEV
jgi:hypothetical protein